MTTKLESGEIIDLDKVSNKEVENLDLDWSPSGCGGCGGKAKRHFEPRPEGDDKPSTPAIVPLELPGFPAGPAIPGSDGRLGFTGGIPIRARCADGLPPRMTTPMSCDACTVTWSAPHPDYPRLTPGTAILPGICGAVLSGYLKRFLPGSDSPTEEWIPFYTGTCFPPPDDTGAAAWALSRLGTAYAACSCARESFQPTFGPFGAYLIWQGPVPPSVDRYGVYESTANYCEIYRRLALNLSDARFGGLDELRWMREVEGLERDHLIFATDWAAFTGVLPDFRCTGHRESSFETAVASRDRIYDCVTRFLNGPWPMPPRR